MKCLWITLLAIGLNYQLTAQDFIPGFIVTLEKDTINGFLRDGTDAELSSQITFQTSKPANDKIDDPQLAPADILSFGFNNGRIFKRFLITNTPAKGDSAHVFAKQVLQGKINLYTYSKPKRDQPDIFLVNNQSGRTVHLREPKQISMTDERGISKTRTSFKHLGLINLVKGDSVVNEATKKKVKYNEKSIVVMC